MNSYSLLQWRGERYDGTSSCTGPLQHKIIYLKDTAKKRIKIFPVIRGRRCLLSGRFYTAWAGFFDLTGPVFLS